MSILGFSRSRAALVFVLAAVGLLSLEACSSGKRPPPSDPNVVGDIDGGGTYSIVPTCAPATGTSGGLIGQTATLYGVVLDPAGRNPLYNVSVYIPRGPLPPLSTGVSCDHCGATVLNPLVSVLTDERGGFSLTNVPMGKQTLVIQVGKWRKVTTIDVSDTCVAVGPVSLPKNGSEGDMPQIAVTTGEFDALECFLRNVGIDDSEFVPGAGGAGHVHIFDGYGGHGGGTTPPAETALWNDAKQLAAYDIVALSCEGAEHNENKTNMQAMHDYAEAGGRIFGTHYHYTWLKNGPQADFKGVANWDLAPNSAGATYNVNETFPKGAAFGKWLKSTGASSSEGHVYLENVTKSISSVNAATSQDWIDSDANNVKYFTFNAPLAAAPDKQCGRVVFNDIHVFPAGGELWPDGCGKRVDLSPQQLALEFLFFDLSACVQSDSETPTPVH